MKNNKGIVSGGIGDKGRENRKRRIFHGKIRKKRQGLSGAGCRRRFRKHKEKFRNMCEFYEVPLYFLSDKGMSCRAMGKEFQASLAVQDDNFAKAIVKALDALADTE